MRPEDRGSLQSILGGAKPAPSPTIPPYIKAGAAVMVVLAIWALVFDKPKGMSLPQASPTTKPALFVQPTAPAAPTPATQAAAFAPGEAKSAKVPLGLTPRYQDSRMPGWVGVDWQGAILWVEGDGTGLQDLAPRQAQSAPAPAPAYQPAAPQPPEPHCVTVEAAGKTAQACGLEDDDTLQARALTDLRAQLGAPCWSGPPAP
ncbi:MAG TPA: hypothetical protein VFH51_16405, partial [Myxococcota bacterium]|nr:hypothetical protein [Myxococcota bacterium]